VFTSILCPVDFSPHSDRALGYAMDLARLTKAHLTIVTVVDPLLKAASEATGNRERLRTQTQQAIEDLLDRASTAHAGPREQIAVAIVSGDAAGEILKHVTECRADLIVMGTKGRDAQHLVFGSTTERVLREARVPVLAVPAGPEKDT
jgi:nucleotide-binding universal stress UspA family protein